MANATTASTVPQVGFDDIPVGKFHYKMMALTYGAHFQDGYTLGVIGIALTAVTPALNLSTLWVSLIASSAMIGLFIGSFGLGWVANKYGRAKIFTLNFILISICTFLQLFVQSAEQLFVLRLLIGIGLGGDYGVGHVMLAEFLPRKSRSIYLGAFAIFWTTGFVIASFVGYFMQQFLDQDYWRWLLFSAFPFAALVLILRFGTPESPRWLISKGRVQEANAIVHKYFGAHVTLDDELIGAGKVSAGKLSDLFGPKLIRRTAFNCLFCPALVLPFFALYTFLPSILGYMGLENNMTTALFLDLFLVLGTVWGIWCTLKFTRRGFTIFSFFFLGVALFLLGIIPDSMPYLIIAIFAAYTLHISGFNNMYGVYPSECFPTEVRTLGVGLATAASRIGAALGTFVMPFSLDKLGVPGTMAWISGVLFLGGIVSILWAPETKFATLREASAGDDVVTTATGKAIPAQNG